MIAIDTSALVASLLAEAEAAAIDDVLKHSERLLISAATLVEARVVAMRQGIEAAMQGVLAELALEVIAVDAATAARATVVYRRWGRGAGTAGLNFGDCFAYEVAQYHGCPLLFVGKDFAKTDVRAAIRAR